MKMRHLTEVDYATIAGNFTTIQTFINGSADAINALAARVDDVEDLGGSISSLLSRMTTAEGSISSHASSISSLLSRVTSLETWRGAKSSAIVDLSFTVSSDAVSVVGISVPTAAAFTGHTTAIDALKGKVNAILAAMRSREIIA